jgi:hypothetical protein
MCIRMVCVCVCVYACVCDACVCVWRHTTHVSSSNDMHVYSSSYDMHVSYPPPHMTCMCPPPHMTCMYPPPHTGIRKAIKTGLYVAADFDKNEYFYYDDPNNGDMHEVMLGKFIAFKGPRSKRVELVNGSFTLLPSDYVEVFRAKNVTDIVRLNNPEYNAAEFRRAGFQHHDLFFTDCSTPSDEVVDRFLRISESTDGIVAVHCLAGCIYVCVCVSIYTYVYMCVYIYI